MIASETVTLKLEARLLASDKVASSPQFEIVFTNPLQSEVAIFLGDSIDALYIDVFDENGKRIPQRIVAGKRRPRGSDETVGAFSGRTTFVKPTETLKWTVDLSEYFDLPKGKGRVIAKTEAQVIDHDGKVIDTVAQSPPIEFVIK